MELKGYTLAILVLFMAFGAVVLGNSQDIAPSGVFVRPAFAQEQENMLSSELNDENTVIILLDDSNDAAEQAENTEVATEKDVAEGDEAKEEKVTLSKTEQIIASIKKNWDPAIDKMPSLFFTYWQHQSIIDAKNSHGKVRPPTEAELKALENADDINLDPGRRYVSLGGIVYKAEDDWTIWLNGERVTPKAVPKEVLDLRVYKDYIEVKWLDEYSNSVFPLRLRAHQRFNLDMRIFLPG